jgi:hypothetical protein
MLLRSAILSFIALLFADSALGQETVLTFDQPQTAGISGFRAQWDLAIPLSEDGATQIVDPVVKDRSPTAIWSPSRRGGRPGALAFDALNRSLLVRFPGSAAAIVDRIRKGFVINKIELVLPFRDTELWPPGDPNFAPSDGYLYRMNWGVDALYRKLPPRWHAVAWAVRRPWLSDEKLGPTFNAYINGVGFWTRYGAGDELQDRFPIRFGPVELSEKAREGRIDVSALFSAPTFGAILTDRIRLLDCCGFIVNKVETYDARYYTGVKTGAYEWATATGGRAILVNTPKLVVSFSRSSSPGFDIAPQEQSLSVNISSIIEELKSNDSGGSPTAILPSEEELANLTRKFASKPNWMPSWQWMRVTELKQLAGTRHIDQPFYYDFVPEYIITGLARLRGPGHQASPADVYGAWVDSIIGRQPRGWSGFEPASEMTQWYVYRDALPAPARDAYRRYWTAWLMPNRNSAPKGRLLDRDLFDGTLIHPQADQLANQTTSKVDDVLDSYYAKTGDWQGNKSFYRSGFTRSMSTENFNHTAAAGALLGGAIIGSENAMTDGRHGWETYPLRLWSWSRGVSQEDIDHYYFPITLGHQKVVSDFGPTLFDRLMSESMLAKSMDELIAAYHPALRRFVAGSSRTSLEYLLAKQDGLQYLLHTLSRSGTLHDIGNPEISALLPGLQSVIGEEMPPSRTAMQSMTGPWAPDWVANLVDEKPLPYRSMATGDGVATSYLGHNYGLATVTQTRRIQFLAQWRRDPKPVEKMSELVTVLARYGVNETRFANDAWGWITPIGSESFLQHDNKVLMLASPRNASYLHDKIEKEGLRSLQTSIALFNYQQPAPSWEIYVDGKPITELPYRAPAGAKIVIHDGISFLGIIPLPGTDLGGGNIVVLREGTAQEWNKISFKPALVIDLYNLRSDLPITNPDWDRIDKAFGGFALEVADSNDYPSFAAFEEHFAQSEVRTHFEEPSTVWVSYRNGNDLLETGGVTTGDELKLIAPKVNGRPAFLPADVLRDTTTSIQGTGVTIEKEGAVLRGDAGLMKFLEVEPRSGTLVAWNPLPDLAKFSFLLPGGGKIQSDGLIGMARVEVNPGENRVNVAYAWREGQDQDPNAATALVLRGFQTQPIVEVNGVVQSSLITSTIRGNPAFLIPLRMPMKIPGDMEKLVDE